jgi:hypothetical protein
MALPSVALHGQPSICSLRTSYLNFFNRGVRLIYLPPYSPDFNPIEEMFSSFKAHIRRHGARFRSLVRARNRAMLILFFYELLDLISSDHESISGWFRKYKERE